MEWWVFGSKVLEGKEREFREGVRRGIRFGFLRVVFNKWIVDYFWNLDFLGVKYLRDRLKVRIRLIIKVFGSWG